MFAKFSVVACLIGLARAGALQNSALNYGLAAGYQGYAGSYPGYAGAYPGYAGAYPGYAGSYPGYAGSYPGYARSHPGYAGSYPGYAGAFTGLAGAYSALNGSVPTSYVNFEKYTAPRSYNAAYKGEGSYAALNGYPYGASAGLSGLYSGLNRAAGLPYGSNGNYGYGGYGAFGNKNVW